MKPGTLVTIGKRARYSAVNRETNSFVEVYFDQIGVYLGRVSDGHFSIRGDYALFDGTVIMFAAGVLTEIK